MEIQKLTKQAFNNLCLKEAETEGAWLTLSVVCVTLDLRVVGSRPTVGVEIT